MLDEQEIMLPGGDGALQTPENESGTDSKADGGASLTGKPPEKIYTQEEYDQRWKAASDELYRHGESKVWKKIEKDFGFDTPTMNDFKEISARFGVGPRELIRHVLAQLQTQIPADNGEQYRPMNDPRVDALFHERDMEKVSAQWQKDFGQKPDRLDLESIEEIAQEYNISLDKAYALATATTLKEKLAKAAEEKVRKDLAAKHKGKVAPGSASKVTPTAKHGSLRDALAAAAAEIDL